MASFYNQATLSYKGNHINSNITTGEIADTLAVTKTAVTPVYDRNGKVTYVVNIVNSGSAPFSGITLTDDMGAYSTGTDNVVPLTYRDGSAKVFVNGILQTAPAPVSAEPDEFTVTGINIPAGGNAAVVYEADVNSFAPPEAGSEITNTVTAAAPGRAPVTAAETITAAEAPELSVIKCLTPAVVNANGTITYTITVQNMGNTEAEASDELFITDTFDPPLSNISVTLDGAALPDTSYTYDEAAGEFSTNGGVLSVPAAEYTRTDTGEYTVTPGTAVLTVTGTV